MELPSTVGWFTSQPAAGYLFAPPGLDSWQPKKASRHGFVKARKKSHLEVDAVDSVSYMGGKDTFFFCWLEEKAVSYCCLSTDLKQDS